MRTDGARPTSPRAVGRWVLAELRKNEGCCRRAVRGRGETRTRNAMRGRTMSLRRAFARTGDREFDVQLTLLVNAEKHAG